MARLLEVAFDGGIRGGTVLHCIAKGEAGKGRVVSCFDGGKPGGRDRIAGGGMVEADKCVDAWEVIGIVGLKVLMENRGGRLSGRTHCRAGCVSPTGVKRLGVERSGV